MCLKVLCLSLKIFVHLFISPKPGGRIWLAPFPLLGNYCTSKLAEQRSIYLGEIDILILEWSFSCWKWYRSLVPYNAWERRGPNTDSCQGGENLRQEQTWIDGEENTKFPPSKLLILVHCTYGNFTITFHWNHLI